MKILLISFSDNYDHQLSLYSLFESLLNNGEDVYTIGITNPKTSFSYTNRNVFYDVPKRPGITLKSLNISKLLKIYKSIEKDHFDVVYFESLHIWNLYIFKKIRKKTAVFHCIHDVVPHEGKQSFFVKKFNNIIFKNVDKVIVRSQESLEYCRNSIKKSFNKVCYLPLGRKWKEYSPFLSTNKVLFFGRMTRYKGLNNLVKICSDLPEISFNIVGRPIEKEDADLLNILKSMPNVTVCDKYVDEKTMALYFKESECVVLPYNSATQSGVIVDAYSFSRPCIATGVGGIKEQIIDGKTGYVVGTNICDFEAALKKYMSMSPEKKESFCVSAYSYGKQKYSSESIASIIVKLFKEYLEEENNDIN